ncbi:MAG: RIP metalloprotease RseP [Sideroxydans sp.]|nr:RIP metalloprotease RseP [Sideroxydans sp.]
MTTLLAFAVAIAVLVVFHELGHYWIARLCDVKVLRFSVGFGKVLYARHFGRGETEWALSAIPLGGYVRMLDEREGEVKPQELPRAFNRKPVWQRMAIVVAGPVANLLLAIVLYWALFMHGVPGLKPVLGPILPDTPAIEAQLQPQETIVSINGQAIPSWQELRWTLLNLALQGGDINVEGRLADGRSRQHVLDLSRLAPSDLDGDFMRKLGLQLYQPLVRPVIGKLSDGDVAQRAGLQAGDVVKRIDGRDIARWEELVDAVRAHAGQPLQFDVQRGDSRLQLTLTPKMVSENGKQVGKIGAAPHIEQQEFDAMLTEVRYAPFAALGQAMRKTWETSVVSLEMMGKMVTGQVSLKNLSGPITIADYAGQSAQLGLGAYLGFLALISISLGVLNLMPIPLLDGGHLLYYTAELVKGSPVSERAWEVGQNIGIALLVTLMAFALYNDISRLILG